MRAANGISTDRSRALQAMPIAQFHSVRGVPHAHLLLPAACCLLPAACWTCRRVSPTSRVQPPPQPPNRPKSPQSTVLARGSDDGCAHVLSRSSSSITDPWCLRNPGAGGRVSAKVPPNGTKAAASRRAGIRVKSFCRPHHLRCGETAQTGA